MNFGAALRRLRTGTFNLSRWFALTALVSIASIAAASGWLISSFVTERMLRREGELTQQFVQSALLAEPALLKYIRESVDGGLTPLSGSLEHFARIPDALRVNLYDRTQSVIWSSDSAIIGRRFGANSELDRALAGMLTVHAEQHHRPEHGKAEHESLLRPDDMFLEIYMPVRDSDGEHVIGVIEIYKNPIGLTHTLRGLRSRIFVGAAVAATLLYLALFGLVRRADLTIRAQQRALVDNKTMAAIGEMGLAVAHGIRNPLAAIRSSAELALDGDSSAVREAAIDIVNEADRMEAWVRELLSYSQPLSHPPTAVALAPLVDRCLEQFSRELERHRITPSVVLSDDLPAVRGDAMLLGQVLRGLVANAMEAMCSDGQLSVRGEWRPADREVVLSVEDSGPGLTPQQLRRVGEPFYTTKPLGLGVGLALARRVIERFGGRVEIASAAGRGTTVRLHLPAS